jgi:hypothetical protein
MTLKEKIEEEIKKINKPHIDGGYIQGKVDALRWVLSELKNMTCENCKDNNICGRYIRQKYGTCKVTYCSEWEEK